MIREGGKSYTYAWLNKVTAITENGKPFATYAYHADGQIAEVASANSAESFTWDGLALIKRNDVSYTIEPHVNGGTPILSTDEHRSTRIMFNDMLGTTLATVDNGKLVGDAPTSFGESPAKSAGRFFTGKPRVEGLGYAFLFRNYRADLGKWQTSDPLGYPDGLNNFAYCNNMALACVDPGSHLEYGNT
jgi:RHS repeat-associated protein